MADWKWHYLLCGGALILEESYTQKKHVQEPSNTWQTVHYTAGLLSTFHKCSVGKHPNQLPVLLVPLPQMSPEDRKTSLEYIAYNNATELWLHIGTIKPGYRMHCWRWISTKTAGFGFLSYIWVKKVFWEQSTSEKANNTCWANRIICITPDQALVYFILLQSSMVHKKLPPLANTQLERNAGKHSWHNRHYSHLFVLTVEKDISEGKKCKSSFQV